MSIAKPFFNAIAPAVPLPCWETLAGKPLMLPYYHMVSDEALPHVRPLYAYRSVRQFTADLDFFLKYYQPIALADLLAHMNAGKVLPPRSFLVTFDDGFREMAEIAAPILKAKGVHKKRCSSHQFRFCGQSRTVPAPKNCAVDRSGG